MNKQMNDMRKTGVIMAILLYLIGIGSLFAQNQEKKPNKEINKWIEEGISAYNSAEYEKAEKDFRKVLGKDPLNSIASYNLGLTLTEEDKNIEAARFFKKAAKIAENKEVKDKSYFNEGNVWLQKKKYEKAIESYKNALRNNPSDEEARYNLAIAMDKLKKQQKKNKKNKKNNKKDNKKNKDKDKKDKDQNKKNKDQKKKDQKNKGDKKKDQKKKSDQKKNDQQNKKEGDKKKEDKNKKGDKDKKDQQKNKPGDKKQPQQPKPGDQKQQPGKPGERQSKLSPQQVKQLLIGLKNKEKKTQKKIQAKILKGKAQKKKTDKDW